MSYIKSSVSIIIKHRNIQGLHSLMQNVKHFKKYRTLDKLLAIIDECDRHYSEDILVGNAMRVSYVTRVNSIECLNKYT